MSALHQQQRQQQKQKRERRDLLHCALFVCVLVRYGFERARLLAIHTRLTNHVPRTVRCQKAAASEEAADGIVVIQPQLPQPADAATQPSNKGEATQPASSTLQARQRDHSASAASVSGEKPQAEKDVVEAGSSHGAPSSASRKGDTPRRCGAFFVDFHVNGGVLSKTL